MPFEHRHVIDCLYHYRIAGVGQRDVVCHHLTVYQQSYLSVGRRTVAQSDVIHVICLNVDIVVHLTACLTTHEVCSANPHRIAHRANIVALVMTEVGSYHAWHRQTDMLYATAVNEWAYGDIAEVGSTIVGDVAHLTTCLLQLDVEFTHAINIYSYAFGVLLHPQTVPASGVEI